jgi:tripartite-type tricarboxylate transporter receptor subunit TctC
MLPLALPAPSGNRAMPLRLVACLAFALSLSGLAHAQSWPVRPVRMVVPFPAGGPTDVMTRVLSDKLAQAIGQAVVVENKPGAGGTIGSDFVAKSPPDGYTLLMATGSTHSVGPYLGKVPYDPQKDFTPIVYVGFATNVLLVSPKLGVNSVQELIELAKKDPGKLNYSTSGIGSVAHLTSEMFAAMAGIKLTHVPYKGTQLSINDIANGQVAMLFDNVMTGKPHVETATTQRVNAEMNRILADPAVKERFHALGFEITGGTPADFTAVIQSEAQRWSKVIKDANVKPE